MKKLLVFGIIALFIGLTFIPSFNAVSISKSDDTTPPEVKLVWNIEEGIVRFTAICNDDTGIDYVIFTWNGMIVAGSYEEPYEWIIDLETVNKQHICAIASDFAGNSASDCVDFRSRKLDIKSTDDCDCHSDGKTHLAEKLLTRLEKNEVLSNEIDLNNLYDRPICSFLENIGDYYAELLVKYMDLAYTDPDGPFFWFYFSLGVTCEVIIGYIFIVGGVLLCWV